MTNSQIVESPYCSQSLIQTIATRLGDSLNLQFDIVLRSGLSDYLRLLAPSADPRQIQLEDSAPCESYVIQLADQRHVLIIPVSSHHMADRRLAHLLPVYCLVATSLYPFPELTLPLADSVVQAEQLKDSCRLTQQKLDHSLYQITASFEELTWLRSLAEHFEICSLEDGLARAGQATLPALRQLIYAQELALLGVVKEDGGSRTAPPLLAHDGDGLLSEQAILALFLRLTAPSCASWGEPCSNASSMNESMIVWNSPIDSGGDHADQTIRNCLLVPVTKSEELHGWLLAVNKAMPYDAMLQDESALLDQNLVEFGTSEAGLMSTMAVMLATHTKNVNLLCEKEELLMGVLRSLVSTIDAKDAYTGGHSDRVAAYSKNIARQLGLPAAQCEEIYMSGLLHDIGKIGVPDAVLGKPDRLTDEEFEQIKRHPVIGYEILKSLRPFAYLLDGVLHHHESFDGSGYPHGLAGHDIPLMGRIIAVADTYDAMTSNRTYRQGMPPEKAIAILRSGQGKQWDPEIIEAFLETTRRQPES